MANNPMLDDEDFPPLSGSTHHAISASSTSRSGNKLRKPPKAPKPPPINTPLSKFWGPKASTSTLTPIGTPRSTKSAPSLLSGNKHTNANDTPLSDVQMELIDPTKEKDTSAASTTLSTTSASLSTLSTPSTPRPVSVLKQRKTPAAPAAKVAPPPTHPSLDSYKFRAVIEVSVKISKTDQVYPMLREKMLGGLSFIQKFGDLTAAIIPRTGSPREVPIYDESTFPLEQYTTGMHFFVYPNEYSLYPIKQESRMVRLSTNMGFSIDPRSFLHVMKIDLMGIGATFEVKLKQALNTCSKIVFLGAPQTINKSYAKQIMDLHLIPLEKELMAEDPITYPESVHSGPWPSYSMVIEQPGGMFEQFGKGMARTPPPRERRCLQLLCAEDVYDRLAALIKAAKTRGVWTHEFGNGQCYPVEVVDSESSSLQKENYKTMVETHASAQLGLGSSTFSGVKDDRVVRMISRRPDLSGPREPMKISLRHVLRKMCFKGSPLWVCLIRTDKKQGWDICYDGTCPITASYVQEFLKCPAAQIMFWLLKRGFDKDQVESFIKDSFNLEQLTLCAQASYNADIKLAQVGTKEEDMDITTASRRKGSIINTNLGLTEERIKIRQHQLKATVCNLGKYDFSRPQDLRTIRGNASTGEWSTGASLGKSIYRVGNTNGDDEDASSEGKSDSEEDGEDSEEEEEHLGGTANAVPPDSRRVQFSMSLPGGTESEQLVLPEETSPAPLHFPGLLHGDEDADSSDMQGIEMEAADTPSGRFASAVWHLAPENYKVIFGILDQLEIEVITYHGIIPPSYDIPAVVQTLVTDDLRQLLVDGAGDTELMEFLHVIREAIEELRSADVAARDDLDELFRKRPRHESGQEIDDDLDEITDPLNGRLSISGLPSPHIASPLHDQVGGETVDPQGSLLSAHDVTGDVETAPAGGVSG